MGKIIETKINRFDTGMVDDFRSSNGAAVIKHFDIHNYPHKLSPIRGPVAIGDGHVIDNIIVGTDGLFYGLGTDDLNPTLQQLYKISDLSSPSWTALTNSKSGSAVIYDLFVEYKNYFYTARSAYIGRYDRTDVASSTPTYSNVAWTNIAQGVVHPKDDILYIPYDNYIWSLNGHAGSPNITALTLPSYFRITSIVPYGNYLAIAATPVNNVALGSIVYLWDRDATLATLSESIDWGTGVLKVINVLDGYLIGFSDVGGASSSVLDRDSIEIKVYFGGTPQLLGQISTRKQTTNAPDAVINTRVNFIRGRKLYFSLTISGGGTSPSLKGLWAIGKNSQGQFSYNIERVATNDNSETAVRAASIIGNYACMVHTASGTTVISNAQSALASIFTATSVFESLIYNANDSSLKKNLIGVSVTTEPLPAAGQIVLKYRTDENINDESAGWTTIFTEATDDSISYSAVNSLPKDYKEIQFRIESIGGAQPTGLSFKEDILGKRTYD